MAKLPTEQDVGDLPDKLPRRQGLPGWNPQALAQGAQAFAHGFETLGSDMAQFGAVQARQQDASQMANADAAYAVGRIKTTTDLSQTTDPAAATDFTKAYGDNFNAAKATFSDPNLANRWATLKSADLTEDQERVTGHVNKLQNNANTADWMTQGDDVISSAIGAPDTPDGQAQRGAAIDAWNQRGSSLMQSGAITPEQYVQRRQQFGASYGRAWVRSQIDEAEKTGDTSRLEALEKYFTFGPSGTTAWDQPTPPGVSGFGTVNAPYTKPWSQPGESGTLSPEAHYQFLVSQGATPKEALMLTGAGANESSFNPNAVHDPDANGAPQGHGLYGHKDTRLDMRGKDWQTQAVSALQELRASPIDAQVNAASTPEQIADAEMHYERPRGYTDATPRAGDNYTGRLNTIRSFDQNVGVLGGKPGSAAAAASGSFSAIGDSLGVGVAGAVGQKATEGWAKESLPPQTVLSNINALPAEQLAGKRIILSTGASNDPGQDPAAYVAAELKALKAKGLDPSQVTIVGVGPKFDAVKVSGLSLNDALNKAATSNGASFVPLDPTKISPDGVHPTADGYADVAKRAGFGSSVTAAAGMPAGMTANPFIGLPPIAGGKVTWEAPTAAPANDVASSPNAMAAKVGAMSPAGGPWAPAADGTLVATDAKGNAVPGVAPPPQQVAQADAGVKSDATQGITPKLPGGVVNPHLIPPETMWPKGATGVTPAQDGSWSFVMQDGTLQKAPDVRASGAPGAPAPYRTGMPIDWMHPQDKAQLGLELQQKIDQIQKQKAADAQRYSTSAQKDLDARIGDLASGQPIEPKEYDSLKGAYANSPDPAVRLRFAQLDQARNQLMSYRLKSPAEVAADVSQQAAAFTYAKARNPDDPYLPIMASTLDASQKYLKTYQSDIKTDPYERASRAGFLPNGTKALDPSDPQLAAKMEGRLVDRTVVEKGFGLAPGTAPVFTPDEKSQFRKIAAQGGDPMVTLAENLVKGGGPDAAAAFREIGGDVPAFQAVGAHALAGDDPQIIQDIASVVHQRQDKVASKDLPDFSNSVLKSYTDPVGTALSHFGPDGEARVRGEANILMTADAQRQGIDAKPKGMLDNAQDLINSNYNRALGASVHDGAQYGGLTDRMTPGTFWNHDAGKVVVPREIKADDFNKVIGSITNADLQGMKNPPMGANGQPISANQINGSTLMAMPDRDGVFRGKYQVYRDGQVDGDHVVMDHTTGKPWMLDLQDPSLDASLRKRNEGSYIANTGPTMPPAAPAQPAGRAPAPAPQPYRNTPGMVTVTNDAQVTE